MTPALKAMKTEAKRRYKSGFALTEGELRRLHELLVQQIKKTPIGDNFIINYEIKYRNGSVAEPPTIDDVLTQENFGSLGIVRLVMEVSDKEEKPSNMIGIQFSNVDEDNEEYTSPIASIVRGEDRDWVFITNSQLDERIGKIKLFTLNQLFPRRRTPLSFFSALLAGMLLTLASFFSLIHNGDIRSASQLDNVERSWKAGQLKDTGELIIQIARIGQGRDQFKGSELIWPLALIFSVPAILLLAVGSYTYCQPSFNFLWGDYVAAYERRRSRGRFILAGVILVVALGLLVNFISKKIGI